MLYEIKNVQQYEGEPRRIWFFDHDIDLTIWLDNRDEIVGFQLCYDKLRDYHALTWQKEIGYRHNQVDDGENHNQAGVSKGVPILLRDGHFDKERIADIFLEKSGDMPKRISTFVYKRILDYE